MPSRVSSLPLRPSRLSAAVSEKSTRSVNSRSSVVSRVSTDSSNIVEETPDNALRPRICALFADAQRTVASHRKLVIKLRKLQEACCYEPTSQRDGADESQEELFGHEFTRCVLRLMPIKKSESAGEKLVRFVGLFLRYANDKDAELSPEASEDTQIMVETPSTRLTSQVTSTVLPLMSAKDKFVRYRATQLISHIVNSLDSIDDELFQSLRLGLLKRIRDKEAMVRVQAVLGLGRLAGNEVEDEAYESDNENGAGLLQKLLEILQNDPSADVRRSLLVNLPILPSTLPFLLERARDQDPATRRALFSRLLPTLGDFRHLSLSMREKLLRWGLRDRDEQVRKAAGRLFRDRWIEDCAATATVPDAMEGVEGEPEGAVNNGPSMEGLLELLERIDVVNSGVESGVALEAMRGFWEGRPDYREAMSFDDNFWATLSAESVFVARTFNDFCRNGQGNKYEALIEEKMPEVTKLAYFLQQYITALIEAVKRVAAQAITEDEEEDTVEQEFIVEQLLHIAQTLDYSDEVGRRQMYALLRQSLSIPELPEEATKLTIEVLRDISAGDLAGEKEFCSVVLEAVRDVHDTLVDEEPQPEEDVDESFHSARSEISNAELAHRTKTKQPPLTEEEEQEKRVREIMINMKCLHIVQCMLQNISGQLQQNPDLISMLNNLVVPAVRSHEAPVRELGLLCLGLCTLLDRNLAEENLPLLIRFFSMGHEELQVRALHIITDILNQHGAHLLENQPALGAVYMKALKSGHKTPDLQATATIAISKLLLGRVIADTSPIINDLLRTLVVQYFDPSTSDNPSVRQTLSYFLPVYCYSRCDNQARMQAVALDALHKLFEMHEGEDDEGDAGSEMVSLTTIGAHLIDWTDPRKCYASSLSMTSTTNTDDPSTKTANGDVHLDFAMAILERLAGNTSSMSWYFYMLLVPSTYMVLR